MGFGSHIQIGNYLENLESSITPLPKENNFVQPIRQLEEVSSVSPYIMLPALLKSKETLEGIVLKGVDKDYDWAFFESKVITGKIPDYDTEKESLEIMISKQLANLLVLDTGMSSRLFFFGEKPKARRGKDHGYL